MNRYLTKQVKVEAIQFLQTSESVEELENFLPSGNSMAHMEIEIGEEKGLSIRQNLKKYPEKILSWTFSAREANISNFDEWLNNKMLVAYPGYWIIKNNNGNFSICKPEEFFELYELDE
jgi:hypothetical protein